MAILSKIYNWWSTEKSEFVLVQRRGWLQGKPYIELYPQVSKYKPSAKGKFKSHLMV